MPEDQESAGLVLVVFGSTAKQALCHTTVYKTSPPTPSLCLPGPRCESPPSTPARPRFSCNSVHSSCPVVPLPPPFSLLGGEGGVPSLFLYQVLPLPFCNVALVFPSPHLPSHTRLLPTLCVCLLHSVNECVQVSKALLDTAMKRPKKPQSVSIAPGAVAAPEAIGQLLQYREDSLTAQLRGCMARAMKGAGPSGNYTCNHSLPALP